MSDEQNSLNEEVIKALRSDPRANQILEDTIIPMLIGATSTLEGSQLSRKNASAGFLLSSVGIGSMMYSPGLPDAPEDRAKLANLLGVGQQYEAHKAYLDSLPRFVEDLPHTPTPSLTNTSVPYGPSITPVPPCPTSTPTQNNGSGLFHGYTPTPTPTSVPTSTPTSP